MVISISFNFFLNGWSSVRACLVGKSETLVSEKPFSENFHPIVLRYCSKRRTGFCIPLSLSLSFLFSLNCNSFVWLIEDWCHGLADVCYLSLCLIGLLDSVLPLHLFLLELILLFSWGSFSYLLIIVTFTYFYRIVEYYLHFCFVIFSIALCYSWVCFSFWWGCLQALMKR